MRSRALSVSIAAIAVLALAAPAFGAAPTIRPASKAAAKKGGLWQPNGTEPRATEIAFDWAAPAIESTAPNFGGQVAREQAARATPIFSVLIVGTDARWGLDPLKGARADSLHLVVWNPVAAKGTIVGIPRDVWVTNGVTKPGRINATLAKGPSALVAAVNGLGGPKASSYVLTGFSGFEQMVNDLSGLHVKVDTAMNEPLSGAQFAPGWFLMNGPATLAYSRNRKSGVSGGDVGRSLNQGRVLLWSLGKLRRETARPTDLARWIAVMRKHSVTNLTSADLLFFAGMARSADPSRFSNVVIPTKPVTRGGAAVLDVDAAKATALLRDISVDGVIG